MSEDVRYEFNECGHKVPLIIPKGIQVLMVDGNIADILGFQYETTPVGVFINIPSFDALMKLLSYLTSVHGWFHICSPTSKLISIQPTLS